MAVVNIVVATYRGIHMEANQPLMAMMRHAHCYCRTSDGRPLHLPWQCNKGKHSVQLSPPIYMSSVVHWARNQSVARSLYAVDESGRPPADYFLLMDDDMISEPHYLSRLLSYKADIVCGICTVKRDPPQPNIRFWRPELMRFADPLEWDWDSEKLMEIDGAGAAFMLVKREVFEKMAESYLLCDLELAEDLRKVKTQEPCEQITAYWAQKSKMRRERFNQAREDKRPDAMDCWWFQFLPNMFDTQVGEVGEDIGFCWKAKKLGYKIYADPQVLPGHLGWYSYSIRDYRGFVEQAREAGEMPANPTPNQVALEV